MTQDVGQALTFTDFIESDALAGPWFREPSWHHWKVVAKAVFGEPLAPDELDIFRRLTGRTIAPTAPAREIWAVVGRRGGKSIFAAALAVYAACLRDYRAILKPGARAFVMVMAADSEQAGETMGYISGFLTEIPALAALVERRGRGQVRRDVIRLTNRVTIRVQVASFRRLRGRTVVCAICDECAFWYSNEDSANPDAEILKALRPSMLTVPNAILVGISSPYARRGILWDAFKRHYGKDQDPVLVIKADTVTLNPSVDRAVIDEAYEADPDSAGSEYGANFRSDLESYVSPEAVEAVTAKGRTSLPYDPRFKHFAFADPAGGSGGDSMTLSIARHEGNRAVECRTAEWKPPFDPETATEEAAAILKEFKLARVVGDHFGGDWPASRFRAHGVHYERSEHPKTTIYQSMLPLINGARVELLDSKKTLNQLLGLEKSTGRTGKDTITHAPGAHDDRINSLAGACVLALRRKMLEGHTPYKPPTAPVSTLNERGEGSVVLVHRFVTCVCGRHDMMLVGDEERPDQCPQRDWGWSRSQGPLYPSGGTRTLETVSHEAQSFNNGMAQAAREIRRRGGDV